MALIFALKELNAVYDIDGVKIANWIETEHIRKLCTFSSSKENYQTKFYVQLFLGVKHHFRFITMQRLKVVAFLALVFNL